MASVPPFSIGKHRVSTGGRFRPPHGHHAARGARGGCWTCWDCPDGRRGTVRPRERPVVIAGPGRRGAPGAPPGGHGGFMGPSGAHPRPKVSARPPLRPIKIPGKFSESKSALDDWEINESHCRADLTELQRAATVRQRLQSDSSIFVGATPAFWRANSCKSTIRIFAETSPVTGRPWSRWKASTALLVREPRMPSAGPGL